MMSIPRRWSLWSRSIRKMISSREPRPMGRMINAFKSFRMFVSFTEASGFSLTLATSSLKLKLNGVMFCFSRACCSCVEHQASWLRVIMPIFIVFHFFVTVCNYWGGCL